MKQEDEWNEGDAIWRLLGEVEPIEPGNRFVDDTLRAVRLLPEPKPWWSGIRALSPWVAVASCGILAAFFLANGLDEAGSGGEFAAVSETEALWGEIAEVADAEMLAAAADELDSFSDHELVSLIGF